jgi:hypothetical protein
MQYEKYINEKVKKYWKNFPVDELGIEKTKVE